MSGGGMAGCMKKYGEEGAGLDRWRSGVRERGGGRAGGIGERGEGQRRAQCCMDG